MIWRGFRTITEWKHLLSAFFPHLLDKYQNTIHFRTKVTVLSSLRSILAKTRGKLTEKIMSWFFTAQMIWKDFRATTTHEDLLLTCFMHLFYVDGNAVNFRTKVFVLSSLMSISAGPRINWDEKIRCWFFISQMIRRDFRTKTVWEDLLSAFFPHLLDIYRNTIHFRTKVTVLSSLRSILAGPRGELTEKKMS